MWVLQYIFVPTFILKNVKHTLKLKGTYNKHQYNYYPDSTINILLHPLSMYLSIYLSLYPFINYLFLMHFKINCSHP